MKLSSFILLFICFYAIVLALAFNTKPTRAVDYQTEDLCRWYANLDHEKEFAPERWKSMKEEIRKFNWYKSCIDHIKYPFVGDL